MSDNNEIFDDGFEKEMSTSDLGSNVNETNSEPNNVFESFKTQEETQTEQTQTFQQETPVVEVEKVETTNTDFENTTYAQSAAQPPKFEEDFKPNFNQYQNYNPQNPVGAYPPPPPPSQGNYQNYQSANFDNSNHQPPHFNSSNSGGFNPPPQKSHKGKFAVAAVICFCVVIAIFAMIVGSGAIDIDSAETTVSVEIDEETTESTTIAINTNSSEELTAVEVADLVRQSVVGVLCYDSTGQLGEEGSGVIISEEDGYTYIITCAHVISGSPASLGILLLDGSSYEAEIVGYDEETDIGVLRVEATGLPIIEIGDSSALEVGETVYAIGNPGGTEFFGSITDGIVSSIDRSFSSTYSITLIQHNAAINPGNSGGALVNSSGQLVGINSSKIADTDYEGMGFAVPTSVAISIAEDLINYGYVPNRPKLGIEYASISSYQLYSMIATMTGLPSESLVIAGISSDSSLADTEAQVGDLIIAVNGEDMTDSSILLDLIENGEVGDELVLTLCRIDNQYQTSTFDVTVYLVEDVPTVEEETTTESSASDYYYGGSNSFSDFLEDYFGYNY